LDEAFIEFKEKESLVKEAISSDYLFILRSFTKFFGLAGLRVGYGISNKKIIERLDQTKEPWTVNVLAQLAAKEVLRDTEYIKFSAKLDDIANYVPARISALLIPVVSLVLRKKGWGAWRTILQDGNKSPSPNAGIAEAGFAGALGIQLGGTVSYQGRKSYKPLIGERLRGKEREDIPRAIYLMYDLSLVTFTVTVTILWYLQSLF